MEAHKGMEVHQLWAVEPLAFDLLVLLLAVAHLATESNCIAHPVALSTCRRLFHSWDLLSVLSERCMEDHMGKVARQLEAAAAAASGPQDVEAHQQTGNTCSCLGRLVRGHSRRMAFPDLVLLSAQCATRWACCTGKEDPAVYQVRHQVGPVAWGRVVHPDQRGVAFQMKNCQVQQVDQLGRNFQMVADLRSWAVQTEVAEL